MGDRCIQCGIASSDMPHNSYMLWRPRPFKGCGEYPICLTCARKVRDEHAARQERAA